MTEVGTNKLLENDDIVLWEFLLSPGEETPLHTHERRFVSYVVVGSTLQVRNAGGNQIAEVDVPSGDVIDFRLDGDELTASNIQGLHIPASHSARNAGSSNYHEIFVEFKR